MRHRRGEQSPPTAANPPNLTSDDYQKACMWVDDVSTEHISDSLWSLARQRQIMEIFSCLLARNCNVVANTQYNLSAQNFFALRIGKRRLDQALTGKEEKKRPREWRKI